MVARGIRLDTYDDIRQRPISAVGESVLVVDLVDGIGRDPAGTDDVLQLGDDFIKSERHREIELRIEDRSSIFDLASLVRSNAVKVAGGCHRESKYGSPSAFWPHLPPKPP